MVYNCADNTVLMSRGKIAYSGPTLDLFNDDELVEKYKLLRPQLVEFKKMLKDKGFDIPGDIRSIDELAKYLAGRRKRK